MTYVHQYPLHLHAPWQPESSPALLLTQSKVGVIACPVRLSVWSLAQSTVCTHQALTQCPALPCQRLQRHQCQRGITLGLYMAWLRMRALKEVTLKTEPRGMRPLSSKRVMPWKAIFSVMMLMSGKPLSSCIAAHHRSPSHTQAGASLPSNRWTAALCAVTRGTSRASVQVLACLRLQETSVRRHARLA